MAVALSKAQRDTLERFAEALAADCPGDLLEVRLFGSRARGDAKPWSDTDLLIVARDEAPSDRVRAASAKLRESHWGQDVPGLSCVVLEETDFRRHQAMRSLLYRNLRDQGVPVWRNGADLWSEEGIPVIGRERDVKFHLEQGRVALAAAQRDLGANDPSSASSRAYYAAFHAASAALLTENIERAKHMDLAAEFDRLTRGNRLLGKAFHGKLRQLYDLRQLADYGNTAVKDRDARAAVAEAEQFVVAAQGYCQRWLERQQEPQRPTTPRRRPGRGMRP